MCTGVSNGNIQLQDKSGKDTQASQQVKLVDLQIIIP